MSARPKVSPLLQALIEKGLFDQLPVTFSTFFFDQVKEWELLFPHERDYFERLFGLIDRSDPKMVQDFFAPLREVERRMGVNEKVWPKRQFTLDQVDFLNRSAHYPEWRKAIANIFSHLDPLLDAEKAKAGHPRLVIITSPAELPVGPDRMWTRFKDKGRIISLDLPEDVDVQDYIPLLLTGGRGKDSKKTIMELYAETKARSAYDTWGVEVGDSLSSLTARAAGWVKLGYDGLQDYRVRLMAEVRKMLDIQDIRGPRQLGAKLKQLKVEPNQHGIDSDPILAEFVRSVLLSGNGTLLINNTFVEWAAIQAVRRARPSLMVISFGIRNKIKPFSSLLIYTDQNSANPIPTQMDTLGSYVDLEIFNYYLGLEFEKYVEYRRNTVYLFVGVGMDEMLVIAPPDFPMIAKEHPIKLAEVFSWAKDWLNL
jgi:hypothetical protein